MHRWAAAAAALTAAGFAVAPAAASVVPAGGTQPLTIHALLGPGHLSPYAGQQVAGIAGVVTDVTSDEFYLQDPARVGGTPFKQAIAVFTGSRPTVAAGDDVTVSGEVSEFVPDQADTPSSLPVAEIDDPSVTVNSTGNPLPAPVIIGSRGVLPPAQAIYPARGRASIDVTAQSSFRPSSSALDFYFGLDSEYVQVQDPVAVEPTNDFAFAVAPDNGAGAGQRTAAGGLADTGPAAQNSRRLSVYAPDGIDAPEVNTGDHFSGPVIGIMSEFDGNPELDITQTPGVISGGLTRQVAAPARPGELTAATYNLDNLSPSSGAKFATLAGQIVTNLGAPDILAVQEIEDSDGTTDDGVVDATTTITDLVSAIQAAGGPAYCWTQVDPVNDADGGTPGGNIRQVILYRTDTGLSFDAAPGGGPATADSVTGRGPSAALAQSPGRVDPADPSWGDTETLTSPATSRTELASASRKPLAAQFTYRGRSVFVINNHLTAKITDDADFGRYQPPVQWSEIQRTQQAGVISAFVRSVEQADPAAYVLVLGDLNATGFSPTFSGLEARGALTDTEHLLPKTAQYDYVFDGDSEELSGILASPALERTVTFAGPVHINADFAGQTSDHDPLLAYFAIPPAR